MEMKKSGNGLFEEIKIKTVMKVYGISRSKAMELIAGRAAAKASCADGGKGDACAAGDGRFAHDHDGEFMSAEEFFGE